jgi:hypothetical protein
MLATSTYGSNIVIAPTADAEIRETQPEYTRGFGPPAVSGGGQTGELQISSGVIGTGNRNLALIRFQLPPEIQTPADLQGFADLQFYFRSQFASGATSFRVYGLNPANALNTAWDEQNVMYRDAGIHQNPNPLIGSGQTLATPSVLAQPSPGQVSVADPVPPIVPTAGYGADPNHPRRAPGIRYEDAPFSQQVVNENNARFASNQAQRAAFLAGQAFTPYLPYIAQPGYGMSLTASLAVPDALSQVGGYTNIWNDVPESNRPFFSGPTDSYVDDLEDVTYLGFTTLPSGTRLIGDVFAFTTDRDGTVENTDPAQLAINLANLVNFLTNGLNNGYRDFTFILGPGIGQDGDILNPSNQQIASKDLIAPIGGLGAFAPRLLVAPEPGTAMAVALFGGLAGLRRRRS